MNTVMCCPFPFHFVSANGLRCLLVSAVPEISAKEAHQPVIGIVNI